jgi:hypothetical protein
MQTRLVPILLLAAMLYALGASVASRSSAPPARANTLAAMPVAIPVLPTVVVRPEAVAAREGMPATRLPMITVRPSAAELALARAVVADADGGAVIALHSMGGAQRSGLDMPYYSFGRSSYRLRKE